MLARDVMTTEVHTAGPETPVSALARMMLEKRISGVPIVDAAGELVGLVTEGDLLRRPETGGERRRRWWLALVADRDEWARDYVKAHGRTAADVMTRRLVTVVEDTPVQDIAELLERHRIKRVPVVRGRKLVGIVSRADLLRALATLGPETTSAAAPSDEALKALVVEALKREAWSSAEAIVVEVRRGVVRLQGVVSSPEEQRALRVLVQGIPGVQGLSDETAVAPPLRAYGL